ncbi:hypothetical protein FJZ36_19005 [Candidatus Poribacteria bacterium]|nr:hypothetical protein [Candidatus Poribacteria bacterium]
MSSGFPQLPGEPIIKAIGTFIPMVLAIWKKRDWARFFVMKWQRRNLLCSNGEYELAKCLVIKFRGMDVDERRKYVAGVRGATVVWDVRIEPEPGQGYAYDLHGAQVDGNGNDIHDNSGNTVSGVNVRLAWRGRDRSLGSVKEHNIVRIRGYVWDIGASVTLRDSVIEKVVADH